MTIEEKILLYPELPIEERLEVQSYVDLHPEWKRVLDDAVALDRVLRDAGSFDAAAHRDEALAFFAASRSLPHTPPELAFHFRQVRDRLQSDPELLARFEELEARRVELERLSPPDEQFRRLLQRKEEGLAPSVERPEMWDSASDGHKDGDPTPHRAAEPRIDRFLWRAAAAVVALAAVYSVLYRVGGMTQPESARLARFDRQDLVVEGFEAVRRGEMSDQESSASAQYLEALDDLGESEQSFFGLFPRFDQVRLDSAAVHLQRVLDLEPERSFLSGEASYLLGKVHLARGEIHEAETLFQSVVKGQGRRSDEAEAILSKLREG
jgi:hypothetical protein